MRIRTLAGPVLAACLMVLGVAAGAPAHGPAGREFVSTTVTENGQVRVLVAGTSLTLRFGPDGDFTASAGCNRLMGTGRFRGDRFIIVGPLASTRRHCEPPRMDQERWFAKFLRSAPRAWFFYGPDLTLRSAGTRIRFTDSTRR
jgi:heat shock protein HslJ